MKAVPTWLKGRRSRSGIAINSRFLLALRFVGNGRSFSVAGEARQDLPEGLVTAGATKPNVRSLAELAQVVGATLEAAACQPGRIALLISDVATRAFVISSRGSPLEAMAPRLPFPESEASWDVWTSGSSWAVGAAVRRAVLAQYEQALEVLGYHASVVEPPSLVRLPEWAKRAREHRARRLRTPETEALSAHVQIHPRHYTIAVFRGAELVDLRLRLRPSSDARLVGDEIRRLPGLYDGAPLGVVTLAGESCRDVSAALDDVRTEILEDGEEAHLKALLTALAHRV